MRTLPTVEQVAVTTTMSHSARRSSTTPEQEKRLARNQEFDYSAEMRRSRPLHPGSFLEVKRSTRHSSDPLPLYRGSNRAGKRGHSGLFISRRNHPRQSSPQIG